MRRGVMAAAAVLLATSATAATITITPVGNTTVVYVIARLEDGDGERFANMTSSLSNAVVSFESPGGDAIAGIGIGGAIHDRGFSTYVSSGKICASACGVAWLSGTRRLMSSGAHIGFHAIYIKTSYGETTQDGTGGANAVLGAYLTRVGLSVEAVAYCTHARPDSMQWLTVEHASGSVFKLR